MVDFLTNIDARIFAYIGLMITAYIVIKDVLTVLQTMRASTGLPVNKEKAISIDGASSYPAKEYISEAQGLAGRPDAVIIERGYFIPVERKPTVNKVRDRHIAQLLVYMRLVEEFEGKRPPYGYLIVGKNARKVKITNTEERQSWLGEHILQLKKIASKETLPIPNPHPRKCQKCKVRNLCSLYRDPNYLESSIK
jgi:CRISPR-associated protein Cas4